MNNIDIEGITDRAIQSEAEDKFNIKDRLIIPMYSIMQNDKIKPCSVALMGEWGCGKTSALYLLRNELRKEPKKNIIIDFDPTVEGKFEIFELMESFYLKLYSALQGHAKVKEIVGKILKSLVLLTKSKWSISGNIGVVSAGVKYDLGARVEYDLGKNIEAVMKQWKKEVPQLMSDKIKELNSILSDKTIFVIIDEIDRLPSKLILNFLMFARILETFNKLVCIIAIDYTRVIEKFINENSLGYCDYNSAASYVDKLFQIRFDICNSINRDNSTRYAREKLENIIFDQKTDCDHLLEQINHDYESQLYFQEIISYLSTPRSINKWLMNIIKNKGFINNAQNKLDWLAFMAILTKFPIILDNIIRILLPNWFNNTASSVGLKMEIEQKYNIKINKDVNDDYILCVLAGIKTENIRNGYAELNSLLQKVTNNPIEDMQTEKFFRNFIKKAPKYLFSIFLNGTITDEELTYYSDFFAANVDNVLSYFIKDGQEKSKLLLAEDIAKSLERGNLPAESASISMINAIWCTKVGTQLNLMGNPYGRITFTLLKLLLLPIEELVCRLVLSLSEYYIDSLLNLFGIKNEIGKYDFTRFKKPDESELRNKQFVRVTFKNKPITEFDQENIKTIVDSWLKQVSSSLENDEFQLWAKSEGKISILYRYIQWGNMLNIEDYQENLAEKLVNYLNNQIVSQEHKIILIGEIAEVCAQYLNPVLGRDVGNPLKYLFRNNLQKLFTCISKIPNVENINYYDKLQKAYSELHEK